MTISNTFKFRAECIDDAIKALGKFGCASAGYTIESLVGKPFCHFPDVTVTVSVEDFNLDEARQLLEEIDDGDVMVQTCQPADLYTGERNFDLQLTHDITRLIS